MTGQLLQFRDDGVERCALCGAEAAGPCASCRRSVCGDCCTLTEDTSRPWAICLDCDRSKGRSLAGAWWSFLKPLLAGLVVLAAIVGAMHACS